MPHKQKLRPEEKEKIVRRYLAGEVSISGAAEEFSVGRTSVQEWIVQYKAEGIAAFLPHKCNRKYSPELKLQAVQDYLSVGGSLLEEIGKEVHRSLQMEPARFWIREDVYYTYACKNCEQESGEANIINIPKEPTLLPGSFVSAEAVAHIMTQKFVMYSPLYRLEQEFNRQGLKLSRQTMSNWLLHVSEMWLQPI